MKNLINDTLEITFNERSSKFSLWLNGKIVKMASKESTLEEHVDMLIELGRVS